VLEELEEIASREQRRRDKNRAAQCIAGNAIMQLKG